MAERSRSFSPLSSSSFSYEWTYDVFLNFRGEDTRFDFVRNLYNALVQRSINTFMDDEGLRRGEKITPALLNAISESRIAITVLSRNYASSTFCLDELVQILDCIKEKGRFVLPVFYNVEPSEVRHQKEIYGKAFARHGTRFQNDKDKVQKWRQALRDVADISGFTFKPGKEYESGFIQKIVKEVSMRINRKPLHIADYPVGIQSRVQQVQSLLDVNSNEGVQMVGIWGTGGIGKSTIARAVCNSIADIFEGFCFLADVRESSQKHGLAHLQEMLLSEVMMDENITVRYVNKGIPIIKHKLHRKKVLIVLDDVDELEQLQAIAGGHYWFGSGSRIIITTRDKHLLARHGVDRIHEVEGLNQEEALELLTWHAFQQNRPEQSYMDKLDNVVQYASGLPLALEIIGSSLYGMGVEYWNSALDEWRLIPNQNIQRILEKSYDALEEYHQEIFLDIACCFKGDTLEYVTSALSARGRCPKYAIQVLINKCLIKIDSGFVTMHDLIQGMGKEIIRLQSPKLPEKRSRLWFNEDIISILEENKGTEKIEAINLDMLGDKEVKWDGMAFKKMSNLMMLIIRNARFSTSPKYLPSSLKVLDWKGYPYSHLPCHFNPKQLVILRMPESCFMLTESLKMFQSLCVMDFRGCQRVKRIPDLSEVPNLNELWLEGCEHLIDVHPSVGFLGKLKRLSVQNCRKLRTFPSIWLRSLEHFDLSKCDSLQKFPEILGTMENLRDINLNFSGIEELPLSFKNLAGLQKLELTWCQRLQEVRGISPSIKELELVNRNWYSHLSSESRKILLNQALHGIDGLKITIQEDRTPEWLDPCTEGDSVSFWIRKQFPNMAVCFAASIAEPYHDQLELHINVWINGVDIGFPYDEAIHASITSQHIFLFDLQHLIPKEKLNGVILDREWNHVKVYCYFDFMNYYADDWDSRHGISSPKWSGIYVYKKKSSEEDIRFTSPDEDPILYFPGSEGSSSNPLSLAESRKLIP